MEIAKTMTVTAPRNRERQTGGTVVRTLKQTLQDPILVAKTWSERNFCEAKGFLLV